MKHLLAMRFSAFGDVALAIPVMKEFLSQNPDVRITFVSSAPLAPLFEGIDRLEFFPAYPHGSHKGIKGLFRLYRELMQRGPYDAVADLHSVLRTHFLRMLFALKGLPTYKINKSREERRGLTRRHDKVMQPIRPIPERYADVLRAGGFSVTLRGKSDKVRLPLSESALRAIGSPQPGIWIGIAPFSWYTGKTYPEGAMQQVVEHLSGYSDCRVILFGGRGREQQELENWARRGNNTFVAAGKLSLNEELALISHLDVMVSMDSANMHLASIVGTRVVSVWGATHPFSGFLGYGQSPQDAIGVEMDCRPCSTFGKKPCYKGTYECLREISPDRIIQAVKQAAGIL